jgi:hypothetical protein
MAHPTMSYDVLCEKERDATGPEHPVVNAVQFVAVGSRTVKEVNRARFRVS